MTVACSFDNGNPPAPFRLLDKIGQILRNISNEGNVGYSFAVTCEDDWPVIGCEGAGSELNRSVSFLVRCKLNNFMMCINDTSFMCTRVYFFCALAVDYCYFVFAQVCIFANFISVFVFLRNYMNR